MKEILWVIQMIVFGLSVLMLTVIFSVCWLAKPHLNLHDDQWVSIAILMFFAYITRPILSSHS